jgi:hypothetical protein
MNETLQKIFVFTDSFLDRLFHRFGHGGAEAVIAFALGFVVLSICMFLGFPIVGIICALIAAGIGLRLGRRAHERHHTK